MKLLRFRVRNFRSVEDSDWIDVDDVASLIGTNESGKTNLLIPLWKLNPAKDGEINPISDYPRKRYNEIRAMEDKPVFIEADFRLGDDLIEEICQLTGASRSEVAIVRLKRKFDGGRTVGFPEFIANKSVTEAEVANLIAQAKDDIDGMSVGKKEEALKSEIDSTLVGVLAKISGKGKLERKAILSIKEGLNSIALDGGNKRSTIVPRYGQLVDSIDEIASSLERPSPSSNEEARDLIVKNMPSFVYYSNYGNLDSEIYLPHVIQNLQRDNLGAKEQAKARTLKVLFEFVKLSPQEILELGKGLPVGQTAPTQEQIKQVAEKKKERDILLQSAGTDLTDKFRAWWKQGEYRFRFQADGDFFRIWVSDDKRTEDIELEGRSTGLQWFLSFYLIFLVESQDSHQGAILLLDEPGVTLHPLAQRDLSEFFANLATTNQIIYTTHSPFLVDSDHLDKVKAVFVDEAGLTRVSANLRASEPDSAQTRSVYPVHAALGLSVSDTLLQGSKPVIVEGPSDQIYLSAIKNYLIGKGLIRPSRELIFIPSGGVKGITAIVALLGAREGELPIVFLDSDTVGLGMAKALRSNLYSHEKDRILLAGELRAKEGAEIEDILPTEFLAKVITRYLRARDADDEFDEVVNDQEPIIDQVEAYSKANNITLEQGWKVEVARAAKARLLKNEDLEKYEKGIDEILTGIFEKLA